MIAWHPAGGAAAGHWASATDAFEAAPKIRFSRDELVNVGGWHDRRLPLDEVGRLVDKADLILEFEACLRTRNAVFGLPQLDVACCLDLVLDRRIGHPVGGEDGAGLAQLGILLGDDLAIENARKAARTQEHGSRHIAVRR